MVSKSYHLASLIILQALVFFGIPSSRLVHAQNEITVEVGPGEMVYDHTTDKCGRSDIPDLPASVFRDTQDRIHLISTHVTNLQMVGSDVNTLIHECDVIMHSDFDPRPDRFNYKEWISATYTLDGEEIHAILHSEYLGAEIPGMCTSEDHFDCWYNTLSYAVSTNQGQTFSHAAPPHQFLAGIPYQYVIDDGPMGVLEASNIIEKDGYYYVFFVTHEYIDQQFGSGLMRTNDLADPDSWRCWDGQGFNVRFIDPYREQPDDSDPANHVCAPVDRPNIGSLHNSVTYSTYLQKYILVGHQGLVFDDEGQPVYGFIYSLSDDLIHWSPKQLLWENGAWNAPTTPGADRLGYPSLIDPGDTSLNFEKIDHEAYVYYTVWNTGRGLDRDLLRRKVTFVDNTAPAVEISAPSKGEANVQDVVSYTVTYSDVAAVTVNLEKKDVILNASQGVDKDNVDVSVTPNGGDTWTVSLSHINGDGDLGISIAEGTASDAPGNVARAAGPSETFVVDNTPPVVSIGEPSVSETAMGPVEYLLSYEGAQVVYLTMDKVAVDWDGVSGEYKVIDGDTPMPKVVMNDLTGVGTVRILILYDTARDSVGNRSPRTDWSQVVLVDNTDTDEDGEPDLNDLDDDNDGFEDTYEEAHSECLDPLQADDPDVDEDGDGLTLLEEFTISEQLNPCDADTDGDKIDDLLDGEPLIGDNVCSGSDEAMLMEEVNAGEEIQCGAAISITVSPDVEELGLLRLISPKVIFNAGGVSGELVIDSSHPCQACGP